MVSGADNLGASRRKSLVSTRREELQQMMFHLLVVTGVLLVLGLIALFSASTAPLAAAGRYPYSVVLRQCGFIAIGLVLMGLMARVFIPPMPDSVLKFACRLAFLINLLLLVAVNFTPLGPEINGAHRWLKLGGFQFQPSEFLKITAVLFIAAVLLGPKAQKAFTTFRTERGNTMTIPRNRLRMAFVYLGCLASLGLVVIQPDLGSTAIILVVILATLMLIGVPVKSILKFLLVLVFLGAAGYFVAPQKYFYAIERITTAMDPMSDVSDSGYQIVQSLGAINKGGLLGRGYMNSLQKMNRLPLQDRDFIFAVWVEEMGMIGGLLVICLFLYFAFIALRLSTLLPFSFEAVGVVALGFTVSFQALINVATNVGVLPVSGLTLPFFSSGGTSMIVSLLIVGIMLGLVNRQLRQASRGRS
jgi:cell division protein FtsW